MVIKIQPRYCVLNSGRLLIVQPHPLHGESQRIFNFVLTLSQIIKQIFIVGNIDLNRNSGKLVDQIYGNASFTCTNRNIVPMMDDDVDLKGLPFATTISLNRVQNVSRSQAEFVDLIVIAVSLEYLIKPFGFSINLDSFIFRGIPDTVGVKLNQEKAYVISRIVV